MIDTLRDHRDPVRSLEQTRDDMVARLKAMPLTDRRRADLASRIVAIEDEIERGKK
jgi:hypothetical protein